jgi:hypothetical protein
MVRSRLSFPYAFLTAAAVTDPADDLPAVFRDPADGLPAAFLRPRCWTPDGLARRGKGCSGLVFCLNAVTCENYLIINY